MNGVRVVGERRDEIDIDKAAWALLEYLLAELDREPTADLADQQPEERAS